MKKMFAISALLFALGSPVLAHEGHDLTPGALPTFHGGITKAGKELFIEMVQTPTGVRLYPMDHDSNPVALKDVKLKVKASSRKIKDMPVKVSEKTEAKPIDSHFVIDVDAKGAVQYNLEVSATYKGETERVKFTVEPQI